MRYIQFHGIPHLAGPSPAGFNAREVLVAQYLTNLAANAALASSPLVQLSDVATVQIGRWRDVSGIDELPCAT